MPLGARPPAGGRHAHEAPPDDTADPGDDDGEDSKGDPDIPGDTGEPDAEEHDECDELKLEVSTLYEIMKDASLSQDDRDAIQEQINDLQEQLEDCEE